MGRPVKRKGKKRKFRFGPVRKMKNAGPSVERERCGIILKKASVRVDEMWRNTDFVLDALRRPVVKVEDIAPLLRGRVTVRISEFEGGYCESTEEEEDINAGINEEEVAVSEEESEVEANPFPLITVVCRISENMEPGMFYLSSQEGNRLQLMRYNGFTFEPYDWNNLSSENIVKGCMEVAPEPECAVGNYDTMNLLPYCAEA